MEVLSGPPPAHFAAASKKLLVRGELLSDYAFGVVMPEAGKSLAHIMEDEKPSLAQVVTYARQVAESLAHLHDKGLVHGDLKPKNVLRSRGRLCLTDLDAAASMTCGEYVGAKVSTGVLPPEMFYKLQGLADSCGFESYWGGSASRSAGTTPIAGPWSTSQGDIVVRTFNGSLAPDAAQHDQLPYARVLANRTVDVWSYGVLLFELLFGCRMLPTNRDDNLDEAETVLTAATWTDEQIAQSIKAGLNKLKERINSEREASKRHSERGEGDGLEHAHGHKYAGYSVDCDEVVDLLQQLLRVNPSDRFQSMDDVLCHSFFFSHSPKSLHVTSGDRFIELARESGMIPIAHRTDILSYAWKLNKLGTKLDSGSQHWNAEDKLMANEVFAALRLSVCRNVAHTISLPQATKETLQSLAEEGQLGYENVSRSIVQNLVVRAEKNQIETYVTLFGVLSAAVTAKHPVKPRQTISGISNLFNAAATAKRSFDKVIACDCCIVVDLNATFVSLLIWMRLLYRC